MGGKRSSDVSNDSSKVPNKEERKEITGTDTGGGQFAKDVMIKGIKAGLNIPVSATEAQPLNSKEVRQLVDEDVPVGEIEYGTLSMTISAPVTGTHYVYDQAFDITYTSSGGKPPRTCGARISSNPITNLVEYLAASVYIPEGSPSAGTQSVNSPVVPGTYYIRGLVTDDLGITALSNQVTIIVDPLSMNISAPADGTHYMAGDAFNITYTSASGKPPRTCGLRIDDAPIANDADYNGATVIQAEGGAPAATIGTTAPLVPGTYYIRGRVTDSLGNKALSNQISIIVDEPGGPVWFLANIDMPH